MGGHDFSVRILPATFFNVVLNRERVSAVSYAESNIDWRRNAALIYCEWVKEGQCLCDVLSIKVPRFYA